MAKLRSDLIDLQSTKYYHCITRCVRREFLLNINQIEKNLQRKEIMEKRIFKLRDCFAINILAYSIMDNHYHIAMHVNTELVENLDDIEILKRWISVFKPHECVRKFLGKEKLTRHEKDVLNRLIDDYRKRMIDISWYMKALNEYIAKKANIEDNVKGHFWEHRFTSIPIVGKERLAETMAYIDLNPLRADLVKCPEEAHFTSLKRRFESLRFFKTGNSVENINQKRIQDDVIQNIEITNEDLGNEDILKAFGFEVSKGYLIGLEPLEDESGNILRNHIDLSTEGYLRFVDMEGREIKEGKRGFIAKNEPPIMERLSYYLENALLA